MLLGSNYRTLRAPVELNLEALGYGDKARKHWKPPECALHQAHKQEKGRIAPALLLFVT